MKSLIVKGLSLLHWVFLQHPSQQNCQFWIFCFLENTNLRINRDMKFEFLCSKARSHFNRFVKHLPRYEAIWDNKSMLVFWQRISFHKTLKFASIIFFAFMLLSWIMKHGLKFVIANGEWWVEWPYKGSEAQRSSV